MANTRLLIPISEEMYSDLAGLSQRLQVPVALLVRVAIAQMLSFENEKAQLDDGKSEDHSIFGLAYDELPEGVILKGSPVPKWMD